MGGRGDTLPPFMAHSGFIEGLAAHPKQAGSSGDGAMFGREAAIKAEPRKSLWTLVRATEQRIAGGVRRFRFGCQGLSGRWGSDGRGKRQAGQGI